MIRQLVSGLRFRILLLVLLGVTPALGLLLQTAGEQTRAAGVEAQANMFSQALQILGDQLLGLALLLVFAILAAWLGSELFVLRQVKALVHATGQLAEGNLSARSGLDYEAGELGQLAKTFDRMGSALEQRENERKQVEGEVERNIRHLTALNTVIATIGRSLDLPEVLDSIKRLLEEQLNVPGGVIYFFEEGSRLRLEKAWGVPSGVLTGCKSIPIENWQYQHVVTGKKAYLEPDFRLVEPYANSGLSSERPFLCSYLCIPLVGKGEVQGVLDLFSRAPMVFSEDQVNFFILLGQQVGVVIQNARLFDQVDTGRKRLQLLSQQLLEIQEGERRRISRELHDAIGQALTAVKVNIQAISRISEQEDLKPHLEESILIIEKTIQQVRNLSLELRPSLLDDLGVVSALRWYIDRQAQRAGFEAHFIPQPPDMRLPPSIETACFRVVQEALTNVVRHAGASQVRIELHQRDGMLDLLIHDNGVGFDLSAISERSASSMSLGLLGMQERVQLANGTFKIQSKREEGTKVHARFPIETGVLPAIDEQEKNGSQEW